MRIWFAQAPENVLHALNKQSENTIAAQLGIEITEIGDDYLRGTMPVDQRTHQPYGLLHGGASVVLAETLGSLGCELTIDSSSHFCVGLEVNANHVRAVRAGTVTGTARPDHAGKTTQVWSIKIHDEPDKLVCIARLTVAVLPRRLTG